MVFRDLNGFKTVAAAALLVTSLDLSAFGFNMGDNFNEGFDFDKGSDLDMGGSKMNWESPDNVWDTGTSGGKGFSWGGGPQSGSDWGFRDTPPPVYWRAPPSYPNPYTEPRRFMSAPQHMMTPFGVVPAQPVQQQTVYKRPPAPPQPAELSSKTAPAAATAMEK